MEALTPAHHPSPPLFQRRKRSLPALASCLRQQHGDRRKGRTPRSPPAEPWACLTELSFSRRRAPAIPGRRPASPVWPANRRRLLPLQRLDLVSHVLPLPALTRGLRHNIRLNGHGAPTPFVRFRGLFLLCLRSLPVTSGGIRSTGAPWRPKANANCCCESFAFACRLIPRAFPAHDDDSLAMHKLSAPCTSPMPPDLLLASLCQLMSGYAMSPNADVAAEIVRCLDALAADCGDASPVLREAGRQLAAVWRKKAFIASAPAKPKQANPDGCHLRGLAEGEHCTVTCCPDCGMVYVQFHSFNVRFPAAVFRSTCQTFLEAEQRLKQRSSRSLSAKPAAVPGKARH